MKRIIIVVLLSSFTIYCFSQRGGDIFAEDKIDDMTGNEIIKTYWLQLKMGMTISYYAQLCIHEDFLYLNIKVGTGFVTSVPEDAKLIFKFKDNTTITLQNHKYILSGKGEGAIGLIGASQIGINPIYSITLSDLETFEKQNIVKLRLYLRDKYIETKISQNKAKIFSNYCEAMKKRINKS
ncbi:unnamed protein product [marine sediment metagenome]|uniref:Uncharacterized protein n=1 Tax=marine sediment metagenome TaxID=412755 RepID=X1AFN0_9ZZZZ